MEVKFFRRTLVIFLFAGFQIFSCPSLQALSQLCSSAHYILSGVKTLVKMAAQISTRNG